MKYFYYDKALLEKGIVYCKGVENKKLTKNDIQNSTKTLLYKNTIIYESENPFVGYPIIENNTIRPATKAELIKLGKYQLKPGECIEGESIKRVAIPKNLFIPRWNNETHSWEEGATELDFVKKEYQEYKELDTPRIYKKMEHSAVDKDWMKFMDECELYIYNATNLHRLDIAKPSPSDNLKLFKEKILLPDGIYLNHFGVVEYSAKMNENEVWDSVANVWKTPSI